MRIKGFWSYNIKPNLKIFFELILRIVWGIMIFVNVLHALEVREEIPLWQDIVFITGWYFALQMMKEGVYAALSHISLLSQPERCPHYLRQLSEWGIAAIILTLLFYGEIILIFPSALQINLLNPAMWIFSGGLGILAASKIGKFLKRYKPEY